MTIHMGDFPTPPPWLDDAACASVDPELWFPVQGSSPRPAKKVCATCPVTTPCLTWALETGAPGIWGGTTDAERRRMRRGAA